MISAVEALDKLREGNTRFASGTRIRGSHSQQEFRKELLAQQEPFAVILGCSDSRVPAEIVFDQGLGDLFVIRVAGNIVAPSQIGSVEFAARQLGTRLVVVLGHSSCGAVQATLEELRLPTGDFPDSLDYIVNCIRPTIEPVMAESTGVNPETLLQRAVRANISASVNQLQCGSELLNNLICSDGLLIVGAEYSLETRQVGFFDGVPEPA